MIIKGYRQLAENFDNDIKRFFLKGSVSEILSIGSFVERYFSDLPMDKNMKKEMDFLLTHLKVDYFELSTQEGLYWLRNNYPIKF
ncbi:MAG: hypothetical protein UT05_C0004G0029 [Parcubacteria group bacterium GW2011_GWF2_38_76]|nr:MAG: hypothetical protein UT05_C0004G0029 [Parcubacteria group bacterium GW2011_GWF2_38_76]HBM45666.1 hypothetical protein [Patescibacteria group bacterium]